MSCIDSLSEVNPDIPEYSNLYKGFACVPIAGHGGLMAAAVFVGAEDFSNQSPETSDGVD